MTRSLHHFVRSLAVLVCVLAAPVFASASQSPPDLAAPASIATGEHAKKLGLPKPPSTATPGATPAPETAKSEDSSWVYRTVASLAGVIVLIVAVSFVVQRVARQQGGLIASLGPGGRAPSGLLEVLGRYPISRGTTLVLLKVDRRVLLLCQTSGKRFASGTSMSTLCEMTDPDEVASILVKARDEEGDTLARKFESMLGSFGGKHASTATMEPKPAGGPRGASGLADLLRGNAHKKAAMKPTTPAKPLTKAQAIAALESRLQSLRAQGAKEKAA